MNENQRKTKQAMARELRASRPQLDWPPHSRNAATFAKTIARAAKVRGKGVVVRATDAPGARPRSQTSWKRSAAAHSRVPTKVADLLQGLTLRRRKIILPALESPRNHVLLTLRQLARKLGTDSATLVRILRVMHFRHYRDFQHYIHNLSIALTTSADFAERQSRNKGIVGLVQDSFARDLRNIEVLRQNIDPAEITALAKRILGANRVIIISADMGANLARLLDYALTMLGLNSVAAVSAGESIHRCRQLRRQDLAIAITFRLGLRQTVEGLKQARAAGAYCVGISDNNLSPLLSHAHEFYITPTDGVSFVDSYTAAVAFINALLVACANLRPDRSLAYLRKLAVEQRSGYRWCTGQA